MRFNTTKRTAVVLAACLTLACYSNSQSQKIDFRIKNPVPAENEKGQKVLLVGMKGDSVIYQFANEPGAEVSIPVDTESRIRFSYPYPKRFSEIQYHVLSERYLRALSMIPEPPINLLHFLAVPEPNCNFHLYSEIFYRALVYEGTPALAVEATDAIPWNSPSLSPVFFDHVSVLLSRMVDTNEIGAVRNILQSLKESLPVTKYSELALPIADKLRLLGENEVVESIYEALSQSSNEEMRRLGKMWQAYNHANLGRNKQARALIKQVGEVKQDSPFFAVYCLAEGRLALSEKNYVQALRFLSRAMVRTSIVDSYKPEIYFLMIQAYMSDEDQLPAARLAKEMAVFYPNNMWHKSITNTYPSLEEDIVIPEEESLEVNEEN